MIHNRTKVNPVKPEICRKTVTGVIDEKVSKSKTKIAAQKELLKINHAREEPW